MMSAGHLAAHAHPTPHQDGRLLGRRHLPGSPRLLARRVDQLHRWERPYVRTDPRRHHSDRERFGRPSTRHCGSLEVRHRLGGRVGWLQAPPPHGSHVGHQIPGLLLAPDARVPRSARTRPRQCASRRQ